ncbi:Cupin domain-containing protein [Alistipes timonensis JC136]|uniref:Cupin domain-containing protein n=1 Tax=Alistipes timonensis JC136 TaxID=1033731 RepID=A0A1H3ZM22_9BACT|nr:cupin domain-containing protein [Alistipes timonensis]SEA24856.1 Cupin domain-containing protein [Alistipes timonensis JC136]
MKTRSNTFIPESETVWESCGEGIRRQIMGYDPHLMVVKVAFEKGAVGALHTHYHSQASHVVSGRFESRVGTEKRLLGPGDGYYVAPDEPHELLCLEAGIVLDIFSPLRADFLK